MRRYAMALGGLTALSLLVAVVILGQAELHGGEVSTLPSAANLGPRGLAAARELLRSGGADALQREPGDPAVAGAAVVVLAGPAAPLDAAAVDSLLAEARGGATVVVALGDAPQPALLDALGVALTAGTGSRTARGLAPHRLVGDLSLPARSASLAARSPGALALSGGEDWASAVSFAAGRGEVVVFSGPEPLENAHLGEGDAATLVARLGKLGTVVFDERFLVAPRPAWPQARRALLLLALQLLLAGAALVVARGKRLGAVRPPPAAGTGRTARDYLASLAALYQRSGAEHELAAGAWRGLRRRLERRWGVPATLSDTQAARRLAARSQRAAVALARGSAALAGGGGGVLLRTARAAAEVEAALGRRG